MPSEVSEWLIDLGLDEYVSNFIDNDIDTWHLTELTNDDLKDLGVSSLGHRKTILSSIRTLNEEGTIPGRDNARIVEAERRQLTVMFCDLVGSTEISQQLDPEDLRNLIASFQGVCNAAIKRFDGYVARYMGDGLLVYFGFPAAHEDDAERAVRSGLDVVEEVASLDLPYNFELAVRVGIATGTVVAGDIVGEGASEERTALGETPNLAARLQSIAPPGGVIISETTHHLVEGRINVEALEKVILKGFSEPVQAYRVISIQAGSRFEAATARGMTSFVGRDSELNLLTDRWQEACSGEGQVVLLSGEAGIGKSRIIREFREQLSTAPYTFIRYQCSSYGANTAFLPVIDQIRIAAGFTKDDIDNDRLDKLEKQVRESSNEAAAPLLAALLSLPLERYPNLLMSPVKQKFETISVLVEQLESFAQHGPVVVLVEDVHWIDPSSLEVFDAIVDSVQELPVLLVVTHRPEFNKRWEEYGHVTHHSLKRLSQQDGRMLADLVTGEKKLPENVLAQILESTDGVPLFIEELVKTVLESDVVLEEDGRLESETVLLPMAIPTTLKDSLMARLDKLSPVKEVAQAAACIGREFSSTLLASIIGADGLDGKLAQLVDAGLVFRRGSGDGIWYIFKHALVQDTAYESLLVSRRHQLHARIAQVIAASDNPDSAILAYHFATAEIHDKAAENYLNAGHRSLRLSALTEAVQKLELGLKEIEAMEKDGSYDDLELDIRIALGTARMALFGWPHTSVSDALERAFDLAVKFDRRQALGPILWGLCVHYWTRSEFEPTLYWLDKLETISDEVEDSELSAVRDMTAGCQYFWQAEYQRARGYTTHLRGTYNKKEHAHIVSYCNHDPLVFSLLWAGGLLEWITGYPDRSLELAEEAVMLASDIGHPFNSAFALTAGNECLAERGETKRLLECCDKADEIIEQEALGEFARNMMSNNWRGRALILQGEFESGYALTTRSNEFWRVVGGRICSGLFWSSESLALHGIGRTDDAMRLINQAIDYCRETGDRWMEPELLRIKGEYLLSKDKPQPDNAENAFVKALEVAREHGAKSWELRTAISLAGFWQSRDKESEARDLITPIYEWFREGFDTSDLRAAKSLLEHLS
jgi:class 3 adenylate cyclase/tetratricopeptide (TPR) repeat protein